MTAALLGILLAVAPAGSAQSHGRHQVRSLDGLVRLALAQGREHALTEEGAAALGLNKTPTPLMSLEYGMASPKDGLTRAFSVAYTLEGYRKVPAAIILWRTEQGSRAGTGLRSRNRSFLADLKGKLVCVYENRVDLDGAAHAGKAPIPGTAEQKAFKKELEFWKHAVIATGHSPEVSP
jgi:hypothetical protein